MSLCTVRISQKNAWILILLLATAFVLVRSNLDFNYLIPKRINRLFAMIIGGVCIAWSSITFQTLTGNRILTPAIMGYEAIYLLLQSLFILFLGPENLIVLGVTHNFMLSIAFMLAYSAVIDWLMFRHHRHNVNLLLLFGLVLTIVLTTLTQFIQFKVNPSEFSILLGFSQASFGRAQHVQLLISAIVVAAVCAVSFKTITDLDVLLLGKNQSISLGLNYRRTVRLHLGFVTALVAVSTSLVGPTAFMGVFIANMTYSFARSFKHAVALPMGCVLAIGLFIIAQFAVEHLFNYRTTVSILVNLLCGIWFLTQAMSTRNAT